MYNRIQLGWQLNFHNKQWVPESSEITFENAERKSCQQKNLYPAIPSFKKRQFLNENKQMVNKTHGKTQHHYPLRNGNQNREIPLHTHTRTAKIMRHHNKYWK